MKTVPFFQIESNNCCKYFYHHRNPTGLQKKQKFSFKVVKRVIVCFLLCAHSWSSQATQKELCPTDLIQMFVSLFRCTLTIQKSCDFYSSLIHFIVSFQTFGKSLMEGEATTWMSHRSHSRSLRGCNLPVWSLVLPLWAVWKIHQAFPLESVWIREQALQWPHTRHIFINRHLAAQMLCLRKHKITAVAHVFFAAG